MEPDGGSTEGRALGRGVVLRLRGAAEALPPGLTALPLLLVVGAMAGYGGLCMACRAGRAGDLGLGDGGCGHGSRPQVDGQRARGARCDMHWAAEEARAGGRAGGRTQWCRAGRGGAGGGLNVPVGVVVCSVGSAGSGLRAVGCWQTVLMSTVTAASARPFRRSQASRPAPPLMQQRSQRHARVAGAASGTACIHAGGAARRERRLHMLCWPDALLYALCAPQLKPQPSFPWPLASMTAPRHLVSPVPVPVESASGQWPASSHSSQPPFRIRCPHPRPPTPLVHTCCCFVLVLPFLPVEHA